jgi:hypothetical protein
MPTRNIDLTRLQLLEQRERQDQARLEWLRVAVREATESLDRGEGIGFESMDDGGAFFPKAGCFSGNQPPGQSRGLVRG